MEQLKKYWSKFLLLFASKEKRLKAIKSAKWQQFVDKHRRRIGMIPAIDGKQKVPAVWDPRIQEWRWVDRNLRRRASRRA